MTLDKRVTALEAKRKSQPIAEPAWDPEGFDKLKKAMEKHNGPDPEKAERARHNALPPEEQLAILRANRKRELEKREARVRAGGAQHAKP